MIAVKPRARRAESITPEEIDHHTWLARLAVSLSVIGQDAADPALRSHARKTVDEFIASGACSDSLAKAIRP